MLLRQLFQKKRAEHRHKCERENQRAKQRERNRECERTEHFAFEALKREQRQENDDNNEDSEHDRAADFLRGIKNRLDYCHVHARASRSGFSVR